MTFVFGTKAETLDRLKPLVTRSKLCDQIAFPVAEWRAQKPQLIEEVLGRFAGKRLVVRSSAQKEDGSNASMAGAYLSLVGLDPNPNVVTDAVDRVIASYGDASLDDQVLVQPMVEDVAIAGVVMTRDLDTGGPYYVVNYDDFSGRTDSVTSGAESKTFLVHRSQPGALRSARMVKLIETVQEIEAATGSGELDIEFCITRSDEVFTLQVRPMAARQRWEPLSDAAIDRTLDAVRDDLRGAMAPKDGLFGDATIFGEMPDWNPAEMIGSAPKPLAYSLYHRLITASAWSRARANMGYHDVGPQPLMLSLAGRPYIDVRLSLNSFFPAQLAPSIADRLANYQLARLAAHREYHDKIEFQIAITCVDFAFEQRVPELREAGLSIAEIEEFRCQLTRLTRAQVQQGDRGLRHLIGTTETLEKRRLASRELPHLERARALLDACVPFGIIQFAELARHGFIGVSLLRALEARGVMEPDDTARFLQSIHTVAADIVRDMHAVSDRALDTAKFLDKYGHLRPGTYDIMSPRYDEKPDLYLGHSGPATAPTARFALGDRQRIAIGQLLDEAKLPIDADSLFSYIRESVRLREEAKFIFTRSVSDALTALAEWGDQNGLAREELVFLPIDGILQSDDIGELRESAASARETYRLHRAIRLPHIITSPEDIDIVRLPLGEPTFITRDVVSAPTLALASGELANIDDRIVLIESADPGFDWIFSHRIAGLITKYGGANSHMAIRCAEFGLPAAIGCGERLFDIAKKGRVVELDCAARHIRVART